MSSTQHLQYILSSAIISFNLATSMRGMTSISNGAVWETTLSLAWVLIGASGRWSMRKDQKRSARPMYIEFSARCLPGHTLSKTSGLQLFLINTFGTTYRLPKPKVKDFILSLRRPSESSQRWGSNFSGSGNAIGSRQIALTNSVNEATNGMRKKTSPMASVDRCTLWDTVSLLIAHTL